MEWLSANWVWLLIGIAFIGMHVFGHGGHGGHSADDEKIEPDPSKARDKEAHSGHQHQ